MEATKVDGEAPVEAPAQEKVILFDASKRETHHAGSGFKKLYRRLRANHKVATNKDEIGSIDFENVGVMVFGCPREKFSKSEFDRLQEFMAKGGSILFFSGSLGNAGLPEYEPFPVFPDSFSTLMKDIKGHYS